MTHFTRVPFSLRSGKERARVIEFARRHSPLVWFISKAPLASSGTIEIACASFTAIDHDFGSQLRSWVELGTGVMPDLSAAYEDRKYRSYLTSLQATFRFLAIDTAPREWWKPDESNSQLLALQKHTPQECIDGELSHLKWLRGEADRLKRDGKLSNAKRCRLAIINGLLEADYVEMQTIWGSVTGLCSRSSEMTERQYQDFTKLYITFVGEWQKLACELK